ncbi:MAG TPA: hypothetical protein DHW39_11570 [Erysipelotrichaceae bacterium]|nr:hypothetical protein [Erysipelotrichaceae bacterium]
MLFVFECILAFMILFVMPLWGLYRFVMQDPEKNKMKTVNAELIDCWEYQGYNGFVTGMHGSGGSMSPKEMRYAGVYLLEDGTEITLGADYSLSDIPMHAKGVLKHRKGRMVYFSVTSESCL